MSRLLNLLRPMTSRKPTPKKAVRRDLALEQLEDRAVPAVVFAPKFGVEIPAQNYGAVMSSPPVYLIFKGSGWKNSNTQPYMAAASKLMNSGYFDTIKQYGSDGKPVLAGSVLEGGDLQNGFSHGKVDDAVSTAIDSGWVPPLNGSLHTPIYVVVTKGLASTDGGTAAGFNQYDEPGFLYDHKRPEIWVSAADGSGSSASIDYFTTVLGHEVAEIMTDLGGGGFEVHPGAQYPVQNVAGQIGDFEGDKMNYRMPNGIMVQPLWSRADNAWVVSDGNGQKLNFAPDWNGTTYLATGSLTINGDQRGANTADAITVDSFNGVTTVTINGETTVFSAANRDLVTSTITINAGGGANTINIARLPAGFTVIINSTGIDAISVGKGVNLGNNGSIYVYGQGNRDTLTEDDSIDTVPRTTSIYEYAGGALESIDWSGMGRLVYQPRVFGTININAGFGAISFVVMQTAPGTTTNIDTGYGNDSVSVRGTQGALNIKSSVLNPSMYQARDSVTVYTSGNSLTSIAGPVSVSNSSGQTTLAIDDSADTGTQSTTITNNSVAVGRANVNYTGQVSSVLVKGGSGNNGFQINSTLASAPLTVQTGAGTNNVFIGKFSASSPYAAPLSSLAAIAGPINIQHASASGSTNVTVDDSGETGRSAVVTSNAVAFSGLGLISLSAVDALTIVGAQGSNTINVGSVASGVPVTIYNTAHNRVIGPAAASVKQIYGLPSWDAIINVVTRFPGM